MNIIEAIRRHRERRRQRQSARPAKDWTNSWTPRDWADLPTYHPNRDADLV